MKIKIKDKFLQNKEKKIKYESYSELIPKNEYLEFIKKETTRSICQKKALIIQYRLLKDKYPKTDSNIQFQYYVHEAMKKNQLYFHYLTRLQLLLNHFIPYEYTKKVIDKIINTPDIKDIEVIKNIFSIFKKHGFKKNIQILPDECSSWEFIFNNLVPKIQEYTTKQFGSPKFHYLDVGCGSGKKTKIFSKLFELPKTMIFGADIPNWGPYQFDKSKLPFHFEFIRDGMIEYPDNSFEVVSAILTLHHVPDLTGFIKELKRVLKPNGLLLIIEHDNHNKFDNLITDLQHTLYSYLYDNNHKYLEEKIYNRYFNYMEWKYIFYKQNFLYYSGGVIYLKGSSHYFGYDYQIFNIFVNKK